MPSPATLLSRTATAAALTEAGYPISRATLATKACRGGGPPYRVFGRTALYRWGEVMEWAQASMYRRIEPREIAARMLAALGVTVIP